MKFWVDAKLPPMLANWLSTQFDVEALSLRDLGLRDSTDGEIFKAAQQAKVVVIGKLCAMSSSGSRRRCGRWAQRIRLA